MNAVPTTFLDCVNFTPTSEWRRCTSRTNLWLWKEQGRKFVKFYRFWRRNSSPCRPTAEPSFDLSFSAFAMEKNHHLAGSAQWPFPLLSYCVGGSPHYTPPLLDGSSSVIKANNLSLYPNSHDRAHSVSIAHSWLFHFTFWATVGDGVCVAEGKPSSELSSCSSSSSSTVMSEK